MSVISKPIRPGTKVTITGDDAAHISPSVAETVAVPITNDWGPLNAVTLVGSPSEYDEIFGNTDTAGRRAVFGAFRGQGLIGIGGAGGVAVFRMGVVGTAAKATRIITNTTPATALTLTAKYQGTRAHRVTYVKEDYAPDSSRDVLRLLFDGAPAERYVYDDTNVADLAAQINAKSALVTAVANITGVALTNGTAALAGGNDGSTLTSTEWLNMLSAMEFAPFSILAPFNLVDSGIIASVSQWVQDQYDADRPCLAFVGGASGEVIGDAIDRAEAIDNPNVVTLGVGTYRDDQIGDGAVDLSTAQLVPRVAGVCAARGLRAAMTFARMAGLSVVGDTGPTNDDIEDGIEAGVTLLSHSISADAELKIEKGVTTYQGGIAAQPIEDFGDPRLVRIVHDYKRRMKLWGDENVIGALPVNDDTRQAVKGEALRIQTEYEQDSLIIPGTGTVVVSAPDDPNLNDAIPYSFGWAFAQTANYIFAQGKVNRG